MTLFSQIVNLNDTFGVLMIGTFVSCVLLGGIFLQAYYYFTTYSDGPLVQMTVLAIVGLETVYVCLSIHAVNHYLVDNYLNPLALLKSVWSIDISFGLIGIMVLIVHLSYAYRIYHVSDKKVVIPVAITIIALAHFSLGWILVAILFRLTSVEQIPGLPETVAKSILSSAAAIDIMIASTLSYYLHKKRTGFKQTDKLINRLIRYTINNGILTSVMDLITLSLVIGRPRDFLFFAFSQILSALYGNSLLATFNSRRQRQKENDRGYISSSSFNSKPSVPVFNIGTTPATTEVSVSITQDHDIELQKGDSQFSQSDIRFDKEDYTAAGTNRYEYN